MFFSWPKYNFAVVRPNKTGFYIIHVACENPTWKRLEIHHLFFLLLETMLKIIENGGVQSFLHYPGLLHGKPWNLRIDVVFCLTCFRVLIQHGTSSQSLFQVFLRGSSLDMFKSFLSPPKMGLLQSSPPKKQDEVSNHLALYQKNTKRLLFCRE